nr:YvcK family protein [Salisediminibacterium selenitireducens]
MLDKAKVAVIGGGTGLSVLLRGLKTFPVDISAIITVADDGGSSGRLREELNIPPPGDIRNVLVALSEVEPLFEELLQHRFEKGNGLSGHSLGNLLIAGMSSVMGDFSRGVQEMSRVLNVKGRVIPVSNQHLTLHARFIDGSSCAGESKIPLVGKRIDRVFLDPANPVPSPEAVHALEEANLILLGPGSLYTSIIPNLLVPGIREALMNASAKKVYICNVMTQPGETEEYSVGDHIQAIHDHLQANVVDSVIMNTQEIPFSYRERYYSEGAEPVAIDRERLDELAIQTIDDELLSFDNDLLRHNAIKLSQRLLSLM